MIEPNIDSEGFVRKESKTFSGLFIGLIGGGINQSINNFDDTILSNYILLYLALGIFGAMCLTEAIHLISTHDIKTWKCNSHIFHWIIISCFLLGGIGGLISYYYFKRKERIYLNENKGIKA